MLLAQPVAENLFGAARSRGLVGAPNLAAGHPSAAPGRVNVRADRAVSTKWGRLNGGEGRRPYPSRFPLHGNRGPPFAACGVSCRSRNCSRSRGLDHDHATGPPFTSSQDRVAGYPWTLSLAACRCGFGSRFCEPKPSNFCVVRLDVPQPFHLVLAQFFTSVGSSACSNSWPDRCRRSGPNQR